MFTQKCYMNGDIDQNYSDKLQFLQLMYTVYLPVLLKNAKGKRKIVCYVHITRLIYL